MSNQKHAGERIAFYLHHAGLRWTLLFLVRHILKMGSAWLESLQVRIEKKNFLIGDWTIAAQRNSRAWNADYWNQWDWSRRGEEWTASSEWKDTLVNDVLRNSLRPDSVILEIGPGAGRWSEYLQPLAQRLILVDVSERCLQLCRARFEKFSNVDYQWTDGRHLDFLPDAVIDLAWSYDCFVHINPTDTDSYLAELARVLKPGGRAIIHHPGTNYRDPSVRARLVRSDTTREFFSHLVAAHGLILERQLETYVHFPGDVITIFRRPEA